MRFMYFFLFLCLVTFTARADDSVFERMKKDNETVPKVHAAIGAELAVLESYIRRNMVSSKDPYGFKISKVKKGSPADKAGWKEKDLLLAWNDKHVKTVAELYTWIIEAEDGSKAKFNIARRVKPIMISRHPWNHVSGEIELKKKEEDIEKKEAEAGKGGEPEEVMDKVDKEGQPEKPEQPEKREKQEQPEKEKKPEKEKQKKEEPKKTEKSKEGKGGKSD